jgi:uncharacterized tellurite resistance protein B-like protein
MLAAITGFFESCLKLKVSDTQAATTNKLHLASAALLLELTRADHVTDEAETTALLAILGKTFQLDTDQLETLWQLAQQEARDATSLYQFTSLINESYGYPEKIRLLQDMWVVARADGRVDRYEEHLIRKVADLLHLSHGDFIRAKLATRPEGT